MPAASGYQVKLEVPEAPPPPSSAPPTIRGYTLPCAPQSLIAGGNLALGLGLVVLNLLSLVGNAITLQVSSLVVVIFIVGGGLGLAVVALCAFRCTALYFGFMQYPAGTGAFLILLGVMSWGRGPTNTALAAAACGWGGLSILAHCWLRSSGGSVNTQLLRRTPGTA